jgi:phosphoribosylanthranilate isomerase
VPVRVQIYEVQTALEAEALAALGVDHIGSVVANPDDWKQPDLRETVRMVRRCGAVSCLIPLFSDTPSVMRMLDYYGPDIVHFCETLPLAGTDGDDGCGPLLEMQAAVRDAFPEIQIMRSIPIGRPGFSEPQAPLAWARRFEAVSDWFLTDTLLAGGLPGEDAQPVAGFVGITGRICDWKTAAALVKSTSRPVILAGGIGPRNVAAGMRRVRPAGVDSCTGTNARDESGRPIRFRKDLERVREMVAAVRREEATTET